MLKSSGIIDHNYDNHVGNFHRPKHLGHFEQIQRTNLLRFIINSILSLPPVLSISPHFYIIEVHNIISHFSLSYLYSASLLFSGFPSRPTCFYLCVLLRWLFSVVLWDFWKFCFRHLNGIMNGMRIWRYFSIVVYLPIFSQYNNYITLLYNF